MPQFAPGETKTAIAPIVAKPAGMSCEAELFLGPDDVTKIATSGRITFVSTGVSQSVSLPIAMPSEPGTYHGYIDVFTNGIHFLAYKTTEDVIIVPALVLNFTNPRRADTVAWDARVYAEDIGWLVAPVTALGESIRFEIGERSQFVLVVTEWWSGVQQGPYLVEAPTPGRYTWDAARARLDGYTTINLPETDNRSRITGTIIRAENERTTITIESTEDIAGYVNAAKYFIGSQIDIYGRIPRNYLGGTVLSAGRQVSLEVSVGPYPLPPEEPVTHRWYAESEYRYVREYPDSYYSFSGGLSGRCLRYWQPPETGCCSALIDYTVNGVAPNFRWYIDYWQLYRTSSLSKRGNGPASGTLSFEGPTGEPTGVTGGAVLYAHPDPNKWTFPDPETYGDLWRIENWVKVAELHTEDV